MLSVGLNERHGKYGVPCLQTISRILNCWLRVQLVWTDSLDFRTDSSTSTPISENKAITGIE